MKELTAAEIQSFLGKLYERKLAARGIASNLLPADYDLLEEGLIDSLGVLEMISAIEEEFQIEFDLDGLAAELLTKVGPLSEYIAKHATAQVSG